MTDAAAMKLSSLHLFAFPGHVAIITCLFPGDLPVLMSIVRWRVFWSQAISGLSVLKLAFVLTIRVTLRPASPLVSIRPVPPPSSWR